MEGARSIGVTGHQAREGLDWEWTRSSIARLLSEYPPRLALTSLAVGTDQVFAEEALLRGIRLKAVIPFDGYDRCFAADGLARYRYLLGRSAEQVTLSRDGGDQEAFLAAGIMIADESDLLIAVWDGKPADGLGGTADVVAHALAVGREIVHLDPISRVSRRLSR